MRHDFGTDTLVAVLVPPSLLAVVGAEEPRSCFRRMRQRRTAVLAHRLRGSEFSGHTVSAAEGLNRINRNAQGLGDIGIFHFLLTHCDNLVFL